MRKVISVLVFLGISNLMYGQITKNLSLENSKTIIEKGIEAFDASNYSEAEQLFKKVPLGDTLYHLAQYELSLVYTNQNRYQEAIELLLNFLDNKVEGINYSLVYAQLGNNYSDNNQYEKAIEIYDYALESYPYNYSFYFNKGIVYQKMQAYDKAMPCFEKSILCYPTHQSSHLQLGITYLKQKYYIPGVLALNYAVMISPSTDKALTALGILNDIYVNGFDSYNTDNTFKESDAMYDRNAKFRDLETLVKSNFALHKKFKTKSKINHIVIRQNQFIFENLHHDPQSHFIEEQLYIPYFQMIVQKKKDYDIFSHLLVSNTNIDDGKVNAKAPKMEKDFDAIWARSLDMLKQVMERGLGMANPEEISYIYNAKFLEAFGKKVWNDKKEKVYHDYWIVLNSEGGILREGNFNKGNAEGFWKEYDTYGNIIKEYTLENDITQGLCYLYFNHDSKVDEKQLWVEIPIKDDKINGVRKTYNRSGILLEESNWVDDWYDGSYMDFYPQGKLHNHNQYKMGDLLGEALEYYANGDLKSKITYAGKGQEGSAVYYYPGGKIENEGTIIDNFAVGEWKYYYYDGNVSNVYIFDKNGKENGTWKSFDRNGNVLSQTLYEKGKKLEETFYLPNGKLLYKLSYKNGNLNEAVVYTYDESVRERYTLSSQKNMRIDVYWMNDHMEYLWKQIPLNAKGERHGIYVEYYPNGQKMYEVAYTNDKQDGITKSFFFNGKIKTYVMCKEGDYDGVYIRYFENDSVAEEGRYMNDKKYGAWYSYYMNGNKNTLYIYIDNNPVYKAFYLPDGKYSKESIYKNNLLYCIKFHDEKNEIFKIDTFINGNGVVRDYHLHGGEEKKCSMLAGNYIDTCQWFSFEGKPSHFTPYIEDMEHGEAKFYHSIDPTIIQSHLCYVLGKLDGQARLYYENGTLSSELHFEYGNAQGPCRYYHENAMLSLTGNFSNDVRDGIFTFYAPDGKTVLYKLLYYNDQAHSYALMGKDGKMSDFKPIGKDRIELSCYYPKGGVSCKLTFENGMYQEYLRIYYPNGNLFEETYFKDNLKHGNYKLWYQNAVLKSNTNYYQNLRNGECKEYYDNGNLYQEANYVEDALHGSCKRYSKRGTLIFEQTWYFGNRLK